VSEGEKTEGRPPTKPRSKRLYALWAIVLASLVAAGLICWLVMSSRAPVIVRLPVDSYKASSSVPYSDPEARRTYLTGHEQGWRYVSQHHSIAVYRSRTEVLITSGYECSIEGAHSRGFRDGQRDASEELQRRATEVERQQEQEETDR
jgi:hypothetical protein